MIKLLFKKYIDIAVNRAFYDQLGDAVKCHLSYGLGIEDEIKKAVRRVAYDVVYEEAKKQGVVDALALEVVAKINTMQIGKK